jgi:RimJ/RimL family protein N-acetyltransferase
MSRRDRQAAELLELCRAGDVARAIDLAFGHFADFGCDEAILARLAAALDGTRVTSATRRRFAELRDASAARPLRKGQTLEAAMETRRLTGRGLTEGDRRFVLAVWNDDRVSPTIGGPGTQAEIDERIERWRRHWETYGFGVTLFQERTTGAPIGWGGLQHAVIGIGERLTVGYVVAPGRWGHGYATEIATASVAHAFDALGAEEVHASVLSTNAASRRVLEKAGMSMRHELDHRSHVEVIYAIDGPPG